jgi:mono/diheme cytochrome c family protein
MNARRYLVRLLAAVLLAGLAGCGTARRGTPTGPPLRLTDARAAHGEKTFMRYCNGCHPRGEGGLGPALNNKPLPGFLIRFQVRHGLGVMPSFSDEVIGDEELDDLVAYLKELR